MKKISEILVTVKVEQPSDYSPKALPFNMNAREYHNFKWNSMKEDAESQVKRHLDLKLGYPIYSFVCEHCGSTWTEDSETYNGGCCEEDEKNNPTPAAEGSQ